MAANYFSEDLSVDVEAQELVRAWIKALRGGEYQQGTTYLRNLENRYCCLGVLCDIVNPTGWRQAETCYMMGVEGSLLPDNIRRKVYLVDSDGSDPTVPFTALTYLNDIQRLDFNKIANRLEEGLNRAIQYVQTQE